MLETFYKFLRWYLMAACLVGGFYFLYMANDAQSFRPLMPMVLCFGLGYVLSTIWYKYPRSVQFISFAVFIGSSVLALYDFEIIYILTGYSVDLHYHLAWLGLNAVVGLPVMFVAFKTLD